MSSSLTASDRNPISGGVSLFESLAENLPDIVSRHDASYKYLYVNSRVEDYMGRKPQELLGRNFRELGLPDEVCDFFEGHIAHVFQTRRLHTIEFKNPLGKGFLLARLMPELDEDGRVASVLIINTDITERRKTEEALAYQKKLLETVTDNTDMALFLMDENQCCVYMNEAAEQMTGFSLEELKGKQLHYHIHHTRPDGSAFPLEECPIDQALPAQRRMKGEEVFVHKDGSFYPVAFTASPIVVDGKPTGTVIEVRNTTEEKKREQAAKENKERLQAALDASLTGTFRWNIQTNEMAWDENLDRLFGLPPGKTVQSLENFIEHVHAADRQGVIDRCRRCAEEGSDFEMEFRVIWPDGTLHWLEDKGKTHLDEMGRSLYMTGACVDITEHKLANEALRESEKKFRHLIQANIVGVLFWDFDIGIVDANNTFLDMLGYTRTDLEAGLDWRTITPPQWRLVDLEGERQILEKGQHLPFEKQYLHKDGHPVDVIIASSAFEETGNRRGVTFVLDISKRKKAENALLESESRFRTLAETLPQMVWMMDGAGNIEFGSKKWEEYSGIADVYSAWNYMIHPEEKDRLKAFWDEVFAIGQPFRYEARMKNRDGEYRWHYCVGQPIRDNSHKVVKWVGSLSDIHEQKTFTEKLEYEVTERTRELQRSNEDLQQFAHVASHDLKEPVRKVLIFHNSLKKESWDGLNEKARSYMQKIEKASVRMYNMIEDVLSYSTLNAAIISKEPVDLNKIFQNIEADLDILMAEKGAIIKREKLPVVNGSPVLLHQLFYNLVANSLKFSKPHEPPMITISADVAVGEKDGFHRVAVQDNGIGFKEEEAGYIFKIFSRLNTKDKYEGTGLGLSLCQKIAERHGGSIYAEGQEGAGSRFVVSIPA
jgi:PAS domain S-box-containing protein